MPLSGVPPPDTSTKKDPRKSFEPNALPISRARLFVSDYHHLAIGEKKAYGFEGLTTDVNEDDTAAVFTVSLEEGPIALHTWFQGGGDIIASAYYVYVHRK